MILVKSLGSGSLPNFFAKVMRSCVLNSANLIGEIYWKSSAFNLFVFFVRLTSSISFWARSAKAISLGLKKLCQNLFFI